MTNPHNALPYYELAIRLRPNGILYHYALARYLYRHNNQAEIAADCSETCSDLSASLLPFKKGRFLVFACQGCLPQGTSGSHQG